MTRPKWMLVLVHLEVVFDEDIIGSNMTMPTTSIPKVQPESI